MKILITGATGLVGTHLVKHLFLMGHDDINVLTRKKKKTDSNSPFPIHYFHWDPENMTMDAEALRDVDIVINLAGEGVADGRWNKSKKDKILKSRINGTELLINEIKKIKNPPKKFISASAIGVYGDRAEERLDDKSITGEGYLAEVCKQWESKAHSHQIQQMRTITLRIGIVLSKNGGALSKMLPPFKAGVAGQMGAGDQYMSWIHIDDLVGQISFLMESENAQGIYNGVSPRPVTNYIFTKILGKILKRPTVLPLPTFALRLIFGEMSQILTNSQKVIPTKFINEEYSYKFRSLKDALRDILKNDLRGEQSLIRYQFIKDKPENVFPFFSNEMNLEKLTPPFLKFKVLKKSTPELQEGTSIDYSLNLKGLPLTWRSEITRLDKNKSFVDEQRKGPYKKWTHTHNFISLKSGTLIQDDIIYKVPFGFLGNILAGSFIKKDLSKIFDYRYKKIMEEFPVIKG